MSSNELLFWLSARVHGSWAQFRSAVEEMVTVDPTIEGGEGRIAVHHQERFNLQTLAHVEFDATGCENGWRVTPPTLAICQQSASEYFGILSGARLPATVGRFIEAAKANAYRHAVPGQTDVMRAVASSKEALAALANNSGLLIQYSAPASILSCLPRIDDLSRSQTAQLPSGKDFQVNRFDIGRKASRWTTITVADAKRITNGLLQFKRFQTPEYFLMISGRPYKIPGQVGKFFLLAQRVKRAFRYEHKNRTVVVPAIFKPPLLVDRALALCSGFLPQFDPARRTLTYRDVPEDIAALAADILRQPSI